MNLADTQGAAESLHRGAFEAPHARVRTRTWLVGAFLLTAASAAGYAAYELRGERDQAASALSARDDQLKAERGKTKQLEEQLAALTQAGERERTQLSDLRTKLDEANAELVAANMNLVELVDERGELGAELAEFKQMTRELSRMIDSGRLAVTFRRGRMVVEMKAQVLFASGSAELTADGKVALREVARSLRGFQGRHFIVAGHTDNVPVSGPFENNWALSSARALNVTGALIRSGMRPQQLVAAGYGEFDPITRNTSDAGRQSNRRIEIILEPRLHDLGSKVASAR